VARCFWLGRGDRNAGWADRSGGAEFRLPLLIGVFGFAALQAVIPNKAMSLIVVLTALPARSFAIPFLEVIAHWTIAVNLLAGSLIGAWLGARSTGAPSQLSYIDAGLVDLVVPMCCIALIMVAARRIRIFLHSSSCPVSWRRPGRGSGTAGSPAHSQVGRLGAAYGWPRRWHPPLQVFGGWGAIVGPSARSALEAGQESAGQVSWCWRCRDRGRDGGVDGIGRLAQQGSGRVAQIHATRCWRDRDIAEAHRSAIAPFVDWLRNRVGPVRTGVRGAR
jgi:hypothetical protein